ncbi:MAG: SUF system NifU family Fe-S cluster assembly protein [Brevinematales bacterium]|nr:SUF system NifU family Fe-S cluster assembly protein [Brevinematales bacterium]
MSDIYLEHILDHYKNPRNYGKIENPDAYFEGGNPTCGDMVRMYVKLDDDRKVIKDVKFEGKGCAISQASASLLTELVKGKDIEFVKNLTRDDIINELGIEISPTRMKCAILSLETLRIALFGEKFKVV